MSMPQWDKNIQLKLNELQVEINQLKYTSNLIQQQRTLLMDAIRSLTDGKNVCNELMTKKKGDQIIVPIGGAAHIICEIKDQENIFIDVGSKITVKKPINEGVTIIEGRINSLEENFKKLDDQMQKIANSLEEKEIEFSKLYQQGT